MFQSHPLLATYYTTVVRIVFVVLALFVVLRATISLLRAKSPPEVFAYLSLPGDNVLPVLHWENVIGRHHTVDIPIDFMTVSRNHGTLVRNSRDQWFYTDLGSKGGSLLNGKPVTSTVAVAMGDTLTLGGVDCILMPPSLGEKAHNLEIRQQYTKHFAPWSSLIILTIFQMLTCIQLIAAKGAGLPFTVLLGFGTFTLLMWLYCGIVSRMGQIAFEMETIAFFLCTLNLAVVSTKAPESVIKEVIAITLGMVLFVGMCWWLRDLRRALGIRRILVILSAGLLLFNIVFGSSEFGAVNWVKIGGYMMQPSELVKIAFIFIGSATLDEMYRQKNLRLFVGFSIFCLGCLAVMNDFGTAAIFYVTFLVISFLRSGEFSKLILVGGVTVAGVLLMIRFVPHITARFATWTNAWDFPDAGGYQQVRGMAAAASGGCFGLGAGNGWFHTIFAADTDLVFPLVSEEWGLIIALLMVFCLIALGLFAVRSIRFGRSAFFTIAACAATSLIIFQTMMNVLGSLDIFPFTGVTLPFISNGGTSMLASWGLLAFLKAADTRQNASLAVPSLEVDMEDAFSLTHGSAEDYDAIYGDSGKKKNFDEIYGESAGTRRTSRRSSKSRKAAMTEIRDDVEKWLELDADGPVRKGGASSGRRSAKKSTAGKKSSAKKSTGKSNSKKGGGKKS